MKLVALSILFIGSSLMMYLWTEAAVSFLVAGFGLVAAFAMFSFWWEYIPMVFHDIEEPELPVQDSELCRHDLQERNRAQLASMRFGGKKK